MVKPSVISKWVRYWSLLVGGCVLVTGSGLLVISSMIFLYLGMPNSKSAGEVVAPVFSFLSLFHPVLVLPLVLGVIVFLYDFKQNGILDKDDRLLVEKKKDWRREKAKSNEDWDMPDGEGSSKSVYEELVEENRESGLYLSDKDFQAERSRVRGVVKNGSEVGFRKVKVPVVFIDESGREITSKYAFKKYIEGGGVWTFEVFCSGERAPSSCKVGNIECEKGNVEEVSSEVVEAG